MNRISHLEQLFSRDPASSAFTLLASYYYQKRLYKHAAKVCQVGLKNDPHNIPGQYILAKLLLIKGDFVIAEKVLKRIISEQPSQLNALLLLINAMQQLKRSKKNIIPYINLAVQLYPSHKLIQKYYKQYCIEKPIKKTKEGVPILTSTNSTFSFNPKLATKTFYNLLYMQKKYKEAYAVLKYLQKNKKNKKFVAVETQNIKKKL